MSASSWSSSRATSTCRRRSRRRSSRASSAASTKSASTPSSPAAIPGVIDRWSGHIARRTELSPLVGAWYTELGGLNKWCHIWAYKDAADRFRIREEARAKGIWPPPSGGRAEHDDQAGEHAGRPGRVLAAALTGLGTFPPQRPAARPGRGRSAGLSAVIAADEMIAEATDSAGHEPWTKPRCAGGSRS